MNVVNFTSKCYFRTLTVEQPASQDGERLSKRSRGSRSACGSVWCFFLLLVVGMVMPITGHSQQIEFVERFVLSADREAELSRLVPGSDEFYFFSALDKQLREKHDDVDKLLKAWAAGVGETERFHQMRTREYLLTYAQNPQKTIDFLIWQLGLRFDHEREIPAAERKLPSGLSESALDIERLMQRALANDSHTQDVEDAGTTALLNRFEKLSQPQQTHLLSRLKNPNHERLVSWIAADLQRQPNPTPFGSHEIHSQLTLTQMDQLAQAVPSLMGNDTYVHLYLRKLKPGADENTLVDSELMRTYLETAWEYVSKLDGSQNSLKTNILYNLLKADLQAGIPNLERFKTYLELPRRLYYVHPELLRTQNAARFPVDMNADYRGVIGMPPINDDMDLEQRYL
jgi:hypothetical protein